MGSFRREGSWLRSKETDVYFSAEEFTDEEAKKILPKVLSAQEHTILSKSEQYGYLLVNVDGEEFFVYIWSGVSVELPHRYKGVKREGFKTNKKEEIAGFEKFGSFH